eukprot:109014_1
MPCDNNINMSSYCLSGFPGLGYVVSHYTSYTDKSNSWTRWIDEINGKYTFNECDDNGFPLFVNEDWKAGTIQRNHYNQSIIELAYWNSAAAICHETNLNECYTKWKYLILGAYEDTYVVDTTIYFGPNCEYAQSSHWYNCLNATDWTSNVSVYVAYDDSKSMNGIYDIIGCNNQRPYFSKRSNGIFHLFYDDGWHINEITNNTSIKKATCFTETIYNNSPCIVWPYNQHSIEIDDGTIDEITNIEWWIFVVIYLSFFVAICSCLLYYYSICVQKVLCPPPCFFCIHHSFSGKFYDTEPIVKWLDWDDFKHITQHDHDTDNEDIEMDTTSNNTLRNDKPQHVTQSKKISNIKWHRLLNILHPKFLFHFIFLTALEIYDYYTDMILASQWSTGSNVDLSGSVCLVSSTAGLWMGLFSSVGFIIGIIGHFLFLWRSYFEHKQYLSYDSLSKLAQNDNVREKIKVIYLASFLKVLIEDIPAMIICLVVIYQETVATPTKYWYLSYYSSCLGLTVSVLLFIRKETISRCALLSTPIKILIGETICVCCEQLICLCGIGGLCLMCLVILISPILGFYHPPPAFGDITKMEMGFVMDSDNECITFTMEEWDPWRWETSGRVYDLDPSQPCIFREPIDGIYYAFCWVSDYCTFNVFVNDCWNGDCSPFQQNLTACLGFI